LRKIPEILATKDENEDNDVSNITELRLARRQGEFKGTVSVLCDPLYSKELSNLTKLSLYDCGLNDLSNLGSFLGEHSRLEELNLGQNHFSVLPPDFALLGDSLKVLWLDDCNLKGTLPECLFQLTELQSLRLPGNEISDIGGGQSNDDNSDDDAPPGLSALTKLEMLCLDCNKIENIPKDLKLPRLRSLMIRQNSLKEIDDDVFEGFPKLKLLHLSSNNLERIPKSILSSCHSLEELYLNGNTLIRLPRGFDESLKYLKHLNLSNNSIKRVPLDFIDRFGAPDATGKCSKVGILLMLYHFHSTLLKKAYLLLLICISPMNVTF